MSTDNYHVTIRELCEYEDISESIIVSAVDHEIAMPVAGHMTEEWVFEESQLVWIRRAIRLHEDLDLDWVATAMLIDLLREKERLESENQALRQRLNRFIVE
ncbi:chaperone modulator CbpM [Congregibacter variabilis]|uniref:Chaperone modulator CbpM n=1 Tax=Congregibacter variabilis TaxID=3081200 RepID=A0ABZ0I5G9_9GAMM|nr:chaperone modulator CbpM [Congregibacter sp. IMCC43200]